MTALALRVADLPSAQARARLWADPHTDRAALAVARHELVSWIHRRRNDPIATAALALVYRALSETASSWPADILRPEQRCTSRWCSCPLPHPH